MKIFPVSSHKDRDILTHQEPAEWISREDLQRHALSDTSAQRRVWRYLRGLRMRQRRFWCALRIAGRSFLGHMELLLAKKQWMVDLGPHYQQTIDGHLHENKKTAYRSDCIRAIESIRPWANSIDLEMFLLGFDSGEWFCVHINTPQQTVVPSYLIPQLSNFVNSHTSEVMPAAIAGVTRSDECTRQKL
jgi:hypothetical protein